MSKVLFLNGTATGHLNPTFPVVKELVNRGEEVFYFTTKDLENRVAQTGASFLDYGQKLTDFLQSYRPTGSHPFFTLVEFLARQSAVMAEVVLEKTMGMEFDYVIHDSMMGGGSLVVRRLGLPAVCSCTTFATNKLPVPQHMLTRGFHPQLDGVYSQLESLSAKYGFAPTIEDLFFQKEGLNIIYTSRLFQPDSDAFDESFEFVGPSIEDRQETLDGIPESRISNKHLYISLGTIINNNADFYRRCIEAFGKEDITVILSAGSRTDIAELGKLPENFIVRSYVPQLEVLKRADAFISHGGLNSVSEALYYGVPIVAIPLANDQPAVARRLVSLGAGLELKLEEATAQAMHDAVWQVIQDGRYREAGKRIGQSFTEAGGYKAAADRILGYKHKIGF